MKKHYILNRPMFNRGGVSAYGRGIASNLVTEEQRQRFNYGGRVGFTNGTRPANVPELRDVLAYSKDYAKRRESELPLPPDEAYKNWLWPDEAVLDPLDEYGFAGKDPVPPITREMQKYVTKHGDTGKEKARAYYDASKEGQRALTDWKNYTTAAEAAGKPIQGFEDKNKEIVPDNTLMDDILTGQNLRKNPSTIEDTTVLDVLDEQESKARKGKAIMSLGKMAHDWFTAPTATKKAAATSKGLENIQKSLDPSDALKTKRTYHEWEKARSSTEEKKLKAAMNLSSSEAGQEMAANKAGKTDLEKLTSIYGVTISKAPTKKEKGKTVGIDLIEMGANPEKYKDTVVKDPTRANLYWVIDTNNKPRSLNYKQVIELQKSGRFFNIGTNK
jgi:DNA-binding PadR family transcriptional regulator